MKTRQEEESKELICSHLCKRGEAELHRFQDDSYRLASYTKQYTLVICYGRGEEVRATEAFYREVEELRNG